MVDHPAGAQEPADELATARAAAGRQRRIRGDRGRDRLAGAQVGRRREHLRASTRRSTGKWVITGSRHEFGGGPYRTFVEFTGRQDRSIHGLLAQGGSGGGPRRYYGVAIAIVTDNKDPDELGRVKVKYPWLADDAESFWARIMAPGAGKDYGVVWMPQVGDEVLVAFEHGDINFPIVLGGLWNGKDTIPFNYDSDLDAGTVTYCGFVSRTGHKVSFWESKNDSSIQILTANGEVNIVLDDKNKELKVEIDRQGHVRHQGRRVDQGRRLDDARGNQADDDQGPDGRDQLGDGSERRVHRSRLGLPAAHRRDGRDRPRLARAGDRGGDPAGARHRARRAADAPGVRLPDPRLRLRVGRRRDRGRRSPTRSRTALLRWEPRIDVDDVDVTFDATRRERPVHRHPVHDPAHERPPQPRVPVLRHPGRRLTMALPVPNLDDRRFQDLVDDAKRLVQQRCPEWTDHNVSDPGVTLIELFAWMTDQLVYRLNRVPDRNYVKFLELIGVSLYPPTAARGAGHVLAVGAAARHRDDPDRDPGRDRAHRTRRGDRVHDRRGPADRPVASSRRLGSMIDGKTLRDHMAALEKGTEVYCFQKVPSPGDALYIGLSEAVPSNAVRLRFQADIDGVGVDPTNPPLAWEAWTGDDWEPCELDSDTTGGLNRDGDVVLHVPRGHVASLIAKQRAGWLRARVTELAEGQPAYSASPNIKGLSAITIGGTVDGGERRARHRRGDRHLRGRARPALHAQARPGRARRRRTRCSRSRATRAGTSGRTSPDFAASGPDDRHFTLDLSMGEVRLGPAVRLADGALRNYGAVPPKGARPAAARVPHRRRPAGQRRRRARSRCSSRRSRSCRAVENRRPARGGVDGEDIENAKVRGPIRLRARGRAVTTEDYEQLAREAAPEVARVRAVAAGDGADAGSVRVLIVPSAVSEAGRLRFDQLVPEPRHPPEDHRPARGEPRDRHARDRRAARLSRDHGRRQARAPARGSTRPGSRRRRSSRCTSTSTRSPAAPTGPAGRSGARSTPARSTRVLQAIRGHGARRGRPAVRRRPGDRPARASRPSGSSSRPMRSCSATSTRCWSRAPDARPRRGSAPRTRWVRRCPRCTRTTTSSSGCSTASTRSWRPS